MVEEESIYMDIISDLLLWGTRVIVTNSIIEGARESMSSVGEGGGVGDQKKSK